MSSVREAFVTSVTCTAPPVSWLTTKQSIVPKASSPRSARARAPLDVIEEPRDLRRAEVRVDDEPRLFAHARDGARVRLERLAHGGRAPALPDDREVDGPPRRPVPDERRLALVGDPDRREVVAADLRGLEGAGHACLDARPDLGGVVRDPPWLRVVLRKLRRRAADGLSRRHLDDESRRAGRPLVDCEQVLGHDASVGKEGRSRQEGKRAQPAARETRNREGRRGGAVIFCVFLLSSSSSLFLSESGLFSGSGGAKRGSIAGAARLQRRPSLPGRAPCRARGAATTRAPRSPRTGRSPCR